MEEKISKVLIERKILIDDKPEKVSFSIDGADLGISVNSFSEDSNGKIMVKEDFSVLNELLIPGTTVSFVALEKNGQTSDIRNTKENIDMNNKITFLGNDWHEVDSYIHEKYFVCQDPTSSRCHQLMRKLTKEEFNRYETGNILEDYLTVVGIGEKIFRNRITKEEIRIPYMFYGDKKGE